MSDDNPTTDISELEAEASAILREMAVKDLTFYVAQFRQRLAANTGGVSDYARARQTLRDLISDLRATEGSN
jgi:hypothetical protein